MENDPTATDGAPDEIDEDQTPPPDYEPQEELTPDQTGDIQERPGEQVEDVEAAESDVEGDGEEADDEDDAAEDGDGDDGDDN